MAFSRGSRLTSHEVPPWLRSTPKHNPSVQCGGPPSAARARTDADPICGPRDHVAQPDLPLIRDESRQTNPVGLALTRLLGFACRGFLPRHVTGSRAASAALDRRPKRRAWAERRSPCAHELA